MKLVMVEWVDSHAGQGWRPLDEIEQVGEPVHCRSVGWLAAEEDGCKVLVPHISGQKNENVRPYGSGDLAIPDEAVRSMTVLAEE